MVMNETQDLSMFLLTVFSRIGKFYQNSTSYSTILHNISWTFDRLFLIDIFIRKKLIYAFFYATYSIDK